MKKKSPSWRTKWQPTPVFLPGQHGQRSLAGYSPWDHRVRHDWAQMQEPIWGYWCLSLLAFLWAILIPACVSSNPAFHMMYCACKLNKQGDNIQPWHILFLISNQSVVPCPVLTVAFWPAYRFLRRQVRWSVIFHLLKNFPRFVAIHTVKGFGIVNKAEVDVFLELLLFWWSNGYWQFDLWFLCLF